VLVAAGRKKPIQVFDRELPKTVNKKRTVLVAAEKKKPNRVFDRELPKTLNKKKTVLLAARRKTRTMLMVADGKNR